MNVALKRSLAHQGIHFKYGAHTAGQGRQQHQQHQQHQQRGASHHGHHEK